MAGYSDNPLVKKLGIKPGASMYIFGAPADYFQWLSPFPAEVSLHKKYNEYLDFIHIFVTKKKDLDVEFAKAKNHLDKHGMLWISWPKKSSKVATDVDEHIVRNCGLENGLVDVKVCAVSEVWSGLKFVFRLADR